MERMAAVPNLELERTPLKIQVAREVRRLVRAGYYAPGSRVTEKSVAEALNVSKTPAREALSHLGENGVLRSLPNGGFVVPLLTSAEVLDLYETRQLLEIPALRLAIEQRDDATCAELRESFAELKRFDLEGQVSGFVESFLRFRSVLFQCCNNKLMLSFIERMDNQTEAMKAHVFSNPTIRSRTVDQYGRLAEAFVKGDVEQSQTVLKEHHVTGHDAYDETIAELGK